MNYDIYSVKIDNLLFAHLFGPNVDLIQVCVRRKVGRDGLGTFATF
jgi:hypothetical protein